MAVRYTKNDTLLPVQCPECGESTVPGFGLAGGGYGEYVYCECGFFDKRQEVIVGAASE